MNILIRSGEDLLSIPQAAELIGVTRITAWQWAKDGKMPTVTLGRQTLVLRPTAEEIKKQRESAPVNAKNLRLELKRAALQKELEQIEKQIRDKEQKSTRKPKRAKANVVPPMT
ncbi:MAG: helix-turn-helix domain-containing protein [Patescibacteria group bacterium]